MPVLSLACHLPHNTPHIPPRYNNEQTTKQTKAINNSYIYINISCKCDTNRAGHFTLDAYASRPVACCLYCVKHLNVVHWAPDKRPFVKIVSSMVSSALWRLISLSTRPFVQLFLNKENVNALHYRPSLRTTASPILIVVDSVTQTIVLYRPNCKDALA